jgi:hypothetical protein
LQGAFSDQHTWIRIFGLYSPDFRKRVLYFGFLGKPSRISKPGSDVSGIGFRVLDLALRGSSSWLPLSISRCKGQDIIPLSSGYKMYKPGKARFWP